MLVEEVRDFKRRRKKDKFVQSTLFQTEWRILDRFNKALLMGLK